MNKITISVLENIYFNLEYLGEKSTSVQLVQNKEFYTFLNKKNEI